MRVMLLPVILLLTTAAAPYAPAVDPEPLLTAPGAESGAMSPALQPKPLMAVRSPGIDRLPPALERVNAPPSAAAAPDLPHLSTRLLEGPPGPGEAVCRDRIHEVREERGLPTLDRENADPDEALLIAAVDHRIDGCSVMVMRNDTSDVRPLPAMPAGPPRVQRIPGR